jgi:hypothetical protein
LTATLSFNVIREAQCNNSVGFYETLDEEGSIQSSDTVLKSSDPGYTEAVLRNALVNVEAFGISLSVGNYGNKDASLLLDRSFYMPIVVPDSTIAFAVSNSLNLYTVFASSNLKVPHTYASSPQAD